MRVVMVTIMAAMVLAWGMAARLRSDESELRRGGPSGRTELTPAKKAEAEGLIKKLGDDNFGAREEAAKKLAEMGPEVEGLLKKAAEETKDAEVKARCKALLKMLAEEAETAAMGATRVSIEAVEKPLGEVMKELARQSGNSEPEMEEGIKDRKVTVRLKEATYWEAMEEACKAGGARFAVEQSGQEMKKRVKAKKEDARETTTTAGPARITVKKVRSDQRRAMNLQGKGADEEGTRQLGVEMTGALEDRLPVVEVRLEVGKWTIAGEGEGKDKEINTTGAQAYQMGITWQAWGASATGDDTTGTTKGKMRLEGTVEVSYGTATKELRIERVFETKDGETSRDGKTMTMQGAALEKGTATINLALQAPPEELVKGIQGDMRSRGLFLEDSKGKRYPPAGDPGNYMTGDIWRGFLRAMVRFEGLPKDEDNWTLVYRYPTKTASKRYPFKIDGIPMP